MMAYGRKQWDIELGLAAMCLMFVSSELLLLFQRLACHRCLHDDTGAWSCSKCCGGVDDSCGARATSPNLRGNYLKLAGCQYD